MLIASIHGVILKTETLASRRLAIGAEASLRGIITNFYDMLKSATQGFASFSYVVSGYRPGNLARMDILIAGDPEPAFAEVVYRPDAYTIGRGRLAALKELLPRQLFAVSLQARVGGRVIARETIPALKKDVTGYLYGGDRTRKMKLWKKQQRGKKRLKETGKVSIPPEIFFKLHRR
jgi:GTP-binding protein LepA